MELTPMEGNEAIGWGAVAAGVELPETRASVLEIDFKAKKIKSRDWALAALARQNQALSMEMLTAALNLRFNLNVVEMARAVIRKIAA